MITFQLNFKKSFTWLILCLFFILSCDTYEQEGILYDEKKEIILSQDWYVVEIFCKEEYLIWPNDNIPFFRFNQTGKHQLGSSIEFRLEYDWFSPEGFNYPDEYEITLDPDGSSFDIVYRVLDLQTDRLALMGEREFPDSSKSFCWIILEPR